MSEAEEESVIESYEFHHIDVSKCRDCREFSCEEACKDSVPKCVVVEDREDRCVKCHMCTTACKLRAITID
jgi:Fe-S-cluster-containing hydrogenase component 2